jgi:hypothetical protein
MDVDSRNDTIVPRENNEKRIRNWKGKENGIVRVKVERGGITVIKEKVLPGEGKRAEQEEHSAHDFLRQEISRFENF